MKLSADNKESLDEKKVKNSIKGKVSGKRMQYGSVDIERTINTVDYVDWNAVRRAKVEDISDAILLRGMNIKLAHRIKEFLDRLMKDHGNLDLEWVRNVPRLKAKEFLLSIYGLGLKSVGCVQLLTLKQPAFPVDVNVARVTVRLGEVPIPENTSDNLLMSVLYEYELHYQMITFGKVFCTKKKPSCAECPMRKECKSYADIDIEDSDGMGWLITQRMLTRAKGGSSKSKLRGQEGPVKKDQTHFTLVFDDRMCDDPSPYLLLVWESGDPSVEITPPSGLSNRKWSETVPGTVMD
uniref:HhH-GPD domain-containing protein n=1 Tax=Chenopodium quinoa TaxID=63459 RepID=A0A803MEW7_CHEQI